MYVLTDYCVCCVRPTVLLVPSINKGKGGGLTVLYLTTHMCPTRRNRRRRDENHVDAYICLQPHAPPLYSSMHPALYRIMKAFRPRWGARMSNGFVPRREGRMRAARRAPAADLPRSPPPRIAVRSPHLSPHSSLGTPVARSDAGGVPILKFVKLAKQSDLGME